MAKNGNGIDGPPGEGGEPTGRTSAPRPAASPSRGPAKRTGRMASRPARAGGGAAVRASPGSAVVGEGLGRPERKYTFRALVTAGMLGFVLGRLCAR